MLAASFGLSAQKVDSRYFELRIYYCYPGRLDALIERFQNHTTKIFEKHGMENIGYWVSKETPNTLIYIVAHKSQDSAKASWDAFRKDPVWIKARDASEAGGKIVDKVTSVFMDPVDFSKIK